MSKNIVGLDLNIDKDFLAEAVKQTVLMGISESLNGKNEIVSQIVNAVLSTKVDEKGMINSYESYNRQTIIEFYVKKMLNEQVRQTIQEIMDEQRDDIKKIIRIAFNKTKFKNDVVDAIMNSMVERLTSEYSTTVNVDIKKKESY